MKKAIIGLIILCLIGTGIIVYVKINSNSKVDAINNEIQSSGNKNTIEESKGTTMVDDAIITIVYYEKTMKEQYPAVKFNVKNNSEKSISIEPLGIINNIEMTGRFIISNEEGQWTSPYTELEPGESYDLYFGYMDNVSKQQLKIEKFVDMDLSFHVSEASESNGWKFLKDYKVHID